MLPYTILYMEDNIFEREKMEVDLKRSFQTVFVADNGLSGYEIYKNNKINIVLTDMGMPVMDGAEFIKKVRETDKKIPIIILSYFDKVFFKDLDFNKSIMKPTTIFVLQKIFSEVLS